MSLPLSLPGSQVPWSPIPADNMLCRRVKEGRKGEEREGAKEGENKERKEKGKGRLSIYLVMLTENE